MRVLLLASMCLVACTGADGIESASKVGTECLFKFEQTPVCTYKDTDHSISVTLVTKKIADDELALVQANIVTNGIKQTVKIADDTSMMQGNIGTVLFDDINFDGIPDLAIATSFGVANQYFDYWVYDKNNKTYLATGNYSKLKIDAATKKLSAQVKISAAGYEAQVFTWHGNTLVQSK